MIKIYLLLLTFFCLWQGKAQVSTYSFTQSNQTYTPISGGAVYLSTVLTTLNEEVYSALPIGFTFNYND